MKAKFQFLAEIEAAVGFTGTLMTQDNWITKSVEGTTTMVPQVSLIDFTQLITDPKEKDLIRYFQGGRIAAYEKTSLMKTHYKIANCLNEGLARLSEEDLTHEVKMLRKANSKSTREAPFSAGSFTFQSVEEHGELDYGDSVFPSPRPIVGGRGRAVSPIYGGKTREAKTGSGTTKRGKGPVGLT